MTPHNFVFFRKFNAKLKCDGFFGALIACRSFLRNRWRIWSDAAIDRKYDIDTCGVIEASDMDHVGEHGAHSTGHEPIQSTVFRDILRHIDRKHDFTFLDFGSGKGRAVILAAHYNFRRVMGIEFSPTLHAIAHANAVRFRALRPTAPEIELICEDAALYQVPGESLACFFYNPFGEVVMRKVLDNLQRSILTNPRELLIIYRNPVHAPVFDERDFLTLIALTLDFRIYALNKAINTIPINTRQNTSIF